MEKLKNKKIYIYIGIVVVAIVVAFIVFSGKSGGNGYTVNKGQTLNINEQGQKISINVEQIDEPTYYQDGMFENDQNIYLGIKLSASNLTNKEAYIGSYFFTLLDSNNNEIATEMPGLQLILDKRVDDMQLNSKIPANQTINGYIFFKTNSKDIKKLRISCMTDKTTKNRDIVFGQDVYYEYYYINL